MSSCPLGFTGTPPPGHPKVAGLTDSSAKTASTGEKAGWNPYLLLALDAVFILVAIYVARNGLPRSIKEPLLAVLGRNGGRGPLPKAGGKVE